MARILVAGSLAYDRIMDFPGLFKDHFLPEKLHNINVSFMVNPPSVQFGGTAGNIAYTLALLDEKPDIIANAGNDFAQYQAWLEKHGLDVSSIDLVDNVPTSSAYIVTDEGDNQITAFSAGAGALAYAKPLEVTGVDVAIVAPASVATMTTVPRLLKEKQIPYFFDPGQQIPALSPDELRESLTGAQVLFGNDYELQMILEKTGWDENTLMEHVGILVVTNGAQGSRVRTKDETFTVPAVPVTHVVDPTGAGDAYRAGFIKGHLAHLPLPECVRLASTVAVYAVECYGTQNHRFALPDIRTRYEAAYGTPLTI